MLTKTTDFTGIYYVPNANDVAPDSDLTGNSVELNDFIIRYEPECFDIILGYELSQELQPELDKLPWNPDATETAEDKWVKLVDGDGNYRGLRECILAYVFYRFYENDFEQYTGVGTKKLEAQNSIDTSVRPRAVKAWRHLHDRAIGGYAGVTIATSAFGVGVIYGGSPEELYTSLYKYVNINKDIYPTWAGIMFKNKTQHGL